MQTKDVIRHHRLRLGLTELELANRIGVSRGSVQQWEKGLTTPKRAREDDVARALGISTDELMCRLPPYESISILPDGSRANTLIHPEDAVPIKRLLNAAAMGGGEEVLDDDVVLGEILVSSQFIRTQIRPTSADKLCFLHAYGDSMEPTFSCGDVLLVDTGYTVPKIDGVYVLRAHDRLFVKRLRQRMDGKYEISSDNPTHKTVDVLNGDSEIEVRGRVVWCWNGRKL